VTAALLTRPTAPAAVAETREAPRPGTPHTPSVAYQRVLHQAVRREMRLLAELTGWASPDDPQRASELSGHATLVARLLLQHHATERELLWPALFRHLPATRQDAARTVIADWTGRTAVLDHALRDLPTVARQWAVAITEPARTAFHKACGRLADTIDAHTAEEEAELLPLVGSHLPADTWAEVSNRAGTAFYGREQMLVLGLVLEDACAIDRARVLAGLSPTARTAWRLYGRRTYRATVVRLRGAPPAA
jgi:Hemerythrin HHE cation binding domain